MVTTSSAKRCRVRIWPARGEHERPPRIDAKIRMAAALGLKVIAEGIETPEQLDALRTLGC